MYRLNKMRILLSVLSFVVVNISITCILYNNYKNRIRIDKFFMLALIATLVGNMLGSTNLNVFLSAFNLTLAYCINIIIKEGDELQ